MQWADICWFEWCDNNAVYGSNLDLAKRKKIIIRLHSYEAFTYYINRVNWNNIDRVIFVANHIRDYVLNHVKYLIKEKAIVIPNGIDMDKYTYMSKKSGFNIAYVGYINFKKGPMLLLHTFKAIYDKDHRYKLYIAGKFQEIRYSLYFEQMIKKLGLENNVFLDGWQNNINEWLEDKHYIISTSVLESQQLSIMEAMSKGIKPIIHNFVGAENIYDKEYIWDTINDAVMMVSQDASYNSDEYHSFVKNNYLFSNLLEDIKKLLIDIDTADITSKNIYTINYEGQCINFYLPYLNDWIQNIIYCSKNFYEVRMLEDIKARELDNKVIIDVGANIGNHTVYFAKICNAVVYAFEPEKNLFQILKKNIEINNVQDTVNLYNMAIGSQKGKGSIDIVNENNMGMTRVNTSMKGDINIDTLDHILLGKEEKIDLIKIDVEGMGLEVLNGAIEIIKKHKPVIYIEAEKPEELNVIKESLNKYEYKLISRFNATPTYLFI